MKPKRAIPEKTLRDQATASDPRNSAWVSANAGSGKTHVLAQRVIRLLLAGNRPDKILCLTFTKAAAANMSDRIFRTLADWSTLSDEELSAAIKATGEPGNFRPEELAQARKLFARALETPGGLKTLTIHAFCERLLHSAPFEANLPSSFAVLDDAGKDELIAVARADTLLAAQTDPKLGRAIALVAQEVGLNFEKILNQALAQHVLFAELGAEDERRDLLRALGLAPEDSIESIVREIFEGGIASEKWTEITAFMDTGLPTDSERGAVIQDARGRWATGDFEGALESLASVFRKKDGGAAKLLNSKLAQARPDFHEVLLREQQRFLILWDKLAAARTIERTIALACLVNAIQERYARAKASRLCVDFDDLIERTLVLLTRCSAGWLLKKLDGGIDHILVDEAQDTSAQQWKIIEIVAGEFFSGEGQNRRKRTIFTVGDEKQSIFSFQGARPELFAEKRDAFKTRIEGAGENFKPINLQLSFRSAPGVLSAVDKVFAAPERRKGLSAGSDDVPTVHEAWKSESPSVVEIWDVICPQEREQQRDWKLPLDFRDETDPAVVSARRIAEVIAKWLRDGECVGTGPECRAIRPGDIMILVRRRDAFFEAMTRALKEKIVPTAGSDRLELSTHIAAMDLVALARCALLPEDDLNLANVLKSPFFGFDDDDLLLVAPDRSGCLIDSLRASPDPRFQSACAKIHLLSKMSRDLTPFEFFTRVLGPVGGRKSFLARLGPEAGDVLDELLSLALTHEQKGAPSLHRLVAEFESSNGTVKRDLDNSEGQVRVMTIHAAKGLESRIVFLPDVCAIPTSRMDAPIFELDTPYGRSLPLWSPRKDCDCAHAAALRAERIDAGLSEYRRLLYVALTRAEERLYIAGHRGKNAFSPESWRSLVEQALGMEAQSIPAPWGNGEQVQRFGDSPTEMRAPADDDEKSSKSVPPAWLWAPSPIAEAIGPLLNPSRVSDAHVYSENSVRYGRLVHHLLQILPEVSPEAQKNVAVEYLNRYFDVELSDNISTKVIKILNSDELFCVFSSVSIPESHIKCTISLHGRDFKISGIIDRIAVIDRTVYVAEFKTGKFNVEYEKQISLYYLALKTIYKLKEIIFFIIYIDSGIIEKYEEEYLGSVLASCDH